MRLIANIYCMLGSICKEVFGVVSGNEAIGNSLQGIVILSPGEFLQEVAKSIFE